MMLYIHGHKFGQLTSQNNDLMMKNNSAACAVSFVSGAFCKTKPFDWLTVSVIFFGAVGLRMSF